VRHGPDCAGVSWLLLLPPAAIFAIERIQLDQTRIGEFAEPVGIGEQFNPAYTLPNERLEQLYIACSPRLDLANELTDRDEMLRGKLRLFRRANHNWHIAIETEDVNLSAIVMADFQSLANIASSTPRSASFPGRFGDKASAFLVAVNDRGPTFSGARHTAQDRDFVEHIPAIACLCDWKSRTLAA